MKNVNDIWQWIRSLNLPGRVKRALLRLAASSKKVFLLIMEHINNNQGAQLVGLTLFITWLLSNSGFLFGLVGGCIVVLALTLELLRNLRESIHGQK